MRQGLTIELRSRDQLYILQGSARPYLMVKFVNMQRHWSSCSYLYILACFSVVLLTVAEVKL
jgi:hypothetical protein